jgi:hypothetical protein
VTRYNAILDRGPDPAPRRTKMLRWVGRDGNHERYEEWWLDEDGYPTHPVDAEKEPARREGAG